MKLSVIIPCYNAADTIAIQLEALAAQVWSEPWEVIVADNGSTDGSRAIVEQYVGRIANLRIVDASAKKGAAYARNVAVQAAQSDLIAFCDADDEVAPGWVATIGTALQTHDFVASRFEYDRLNPASTRVYRSDAQSTGLQTVGYPPYLPHAGGCGLGVRRAIHTAVGGFDETLMRLMDTDYCFKVQLAGTPLHFVGDALVHIRYRNNLRSTFRQARLWGQYNVLMYKRYRPSAPETPVWRIWARFAMRSKHILLRLLQIHRRGGVAAWLRTVGWYIGQFEGGVKYRVPPF